ncbi:MAG: molybdopterin biosynthesis protein [Eubacteriales bacterium]|nr:molybdopterin biosynthesis protein [Eubacteriales bacterium]
MNNRKDEPENGVTTKFGYLSNTPLSEALRTYLAFLEQRGMAFRTENIRTVDSLGRVSARAVYARLSSPHYTACAMDGVALQAKDTFGATDTTPVLLCEDRYVRVDTGDPLPEGFDAVVMMEDCAEEDGGIVLRIAAAPWQHVRQIGEDLSAGDMILPSYTEITPALIGAMLAGGVESLEAVARPRVAILPTGDEIVPPCGQPKKGEIMEFNSAIFSAMLQQWGAQGVVYPIVPDDPGKIESFLCRAAEECDFVLLCAGTSAGRDDGSAHAIAALGEVCIHGVAIRPGKPVVLGAVGKKPVVGVPGYPVSGIVVLEELVKPVIDRLLMREREAGESVCVRMGRKMTSSLKYREFVRASLGYGEDGGLSAVPLSTGAGVITSFTKADCLLDVPQNCEGYEAGERAFARLLKPVDRIARTVRILGSHDPLIDEAADELRRGDIRASVSSAHVGSMGAILALGRGEGQLGGIHLLDETDGSYNVSYVEKYLPNGGVALIECVRRMQGFLVAKGNPKGIGTVSDLQKDGVRYANRQKGAGTRILLDYLLKQAGIPAREVTGYEREEMTHTAVAAQVAAASADCGLGIFAAAKMFDLDFVPVCEETYDLLVSLSAMENPQVRAFLRVLSSENFLRRLDALGGYSYDRPGRIKKLWPAKE